MDMSTSELTSGVLDSKSKTDCEGMKVIRGENLFSKVEVIDDPKRKQEIKRGIIMLGSLDLEKLYPSIYVVKAGEVFRDRVLNTEL